MRYMFKMTKFYRTFTIFLLIPVLFVLTLTTSFFAQQKNSSGLQSTTNITVEQKIRVGFDIDDTLLFSTPNFDNALNSSVEAYSKEFWEMVNKSDYKYSKIKPTVKKIVDKHLKNGDEVYIITARKPYGGEHLKRYLSKTFGIPKKNIFFEPENKSQRIKNLKLDIFYGDSDGDVRDALSAGAKPIRILRAKESSYKKNYNVGSYNEEIIEGTEW
ncbi:MAG: HAD family acid phosphatase [Endomicrobiia bacterium]